MATLSLPVSRVRVSFLAATEELRAEGFEGTALERETWRERWERENGFDEYVEFVRSQAREETPRPEGWVPQTTWWWLEGDEFLGRIDLRHRLTDDLRLVGGHIGYYVRPSARRKGHATAMLAAVLPEARGMGIERALLTCDSNNVASRKVIEANGGELDEQYGGKLRYFVPTTAR